MLNEELIKILKICIKEREKIVKEFINIILKIKNIHFALNMFNTR